MFGVIRNTRRDSWFDLLTMLERRMGRAFPETEEASTASWVPMVDIFEEPEVLRITAEIPGVKPEDVKISVEGNLVTIEGTKAQVAEEKTERVHRYERTYGSFVRSFTLPATVDAEQIKAKYEMGVLTLSLPKVEKARARQVKVEVVPEKKLKA